VRSKEEALQKSIRCFSAGCLLERVSPGRFEQAKRLRLKLQDKPLISFTDLTSAVVMQERRLRQILTEDDQLTYLGMGLQKVP
jgi:predicted nucleic acid-binding protein